MSHLLEPVPPSVMQPDGAGTRRRPNVWLPLLVLLVAAFLLVSLPRYLSLDPAQSLVPVNEGAPLHYPMVVAHVLFGSVALVTACLQLWPSLRRTRPAVHRWSGRVYVFGGILPSALLAVVIAPLGPLNLLGALGATTWGLVALVTTVVGLVAARRRRLAEHRRFMLYSFATAIAILTNRAMFLLLMSVPGIPHDPGLAGAVGGFWAGWLINLGVAHWWLHRHPVPRPQDAPRAGHA
ncbi:DUF2306 domain-containing protein [Geodermatophilus maliterrae]|uniref:DUF2306 domain-containing protein n=1 Tax=Geodermatophilus maliterrae TaxID=3162531 RepID=A0ABV3XMK8_9ACTN